MDESPPLYQALIVPALRGIQEKFGYLQRDAVEQFAKDYDLPLYRVQAVASFFPHFELMPPPKISLRVCRDMACHLAGSRKMIQELSASADDGVRVQGVSCLGRCDRAPAACVTVHQSAKDKNHSNGTAAHDEHGGEYLYLGRSSAQLGAVIESIKVGRIPRADTDAENGEGPKNAQRYPAADWQIDPYQGRPSDYAAVRKALAARRASIEKAADTLVAKNVLSVEQIDQFRTAAERRIRVPFQIEKAVYDAVREWQTEPKGSWAAGPELGGWAEAILTELDSAHADLRGMGGAGIPATQKWRDVRDAVRNARERRMDDRAFIVVNGDESEPGTFKDRELLLHHPHLVIEAVMLAGIITEATQGFIYIRHEYHEQIKSCEEEIARAYAPEGPLARELNYPFPISVFTSPGGYICGEQSALIEAMSDRRAEPRNMPPKLETNGLLDQPTLVSNVETFAWAPYIWLKGGATYAALGENGCRGRRYFSISGDVNRPGVYEVPMGMTLRELIKGDQYCRGIVGGRKLKGFAPSGPSGGFLPAKLTAAAGLPRKHNENKGWLELAKRRGFDPAAIDLDLLDMELELNLFRALSPTAALGAGLVVYAEGRDMLEQANNSIQFYRNETCGKCVPCRIGSQKLATLGNALVANEVGSRQWENELLPIVKDLSDAMTLSSICGLGRSVPIPLKTVLDYFPADFKAHLNASSPAAPVKRERAAAASEGTVRS